MNNRTAMLKTGWMFEGLAFKDGHQKPIIKNIPPWFTICTTPDEHENFCRVWSKDEIPDGLQVNWK